MVWVAAGTNCITHVEDDVRDMFCSLSTFQTWVQVTHTEDAKKYVFAHSLPSQRDDERFPEDSEFLTADYWAANRNYVLISTAAEDGFVFNHAAAPGEFLTAGKIEIQFVRYWPEEETELHRLTRDSLNEIGTIIEAFLALSNTATYPMCTSMPLLMCDWDPEDQVWDTGNQFRMVFDFNWTMGD